MRAEATRLATVDLVRATSGTDELAGAVQSQFTNVPGGAASRWDGTVPEEGTMVTLFPCLWFDGDAEEAARFYVALLPDSHLDSVWRSPAETPSGPAGMVLTVNFTLAGQRFQALNGGPDLTFNEAVSFAVDCVDQVEVDRLWDALTADGGEPGPCGWLKDRFGLSWQIVPHRLDELLNDPDPERARRAMEAMLTMGKLEVAELEKAADAT